MKLRAAAAILLCGSAPLALARAAAGQQAFPSGVELVAVDVTVVDRQGRPATDLVVDDFTVTVGRRPRRIVSAQLLRYAELKVAGAAPPTSPSVATTAAASAPVPAAGRLIVLVPDLGTLSVAGATAVGSAARRFLADLTPRDRVALVSIPTGPRVDFTTDHGRVAEALGHLLGTRKLVSGFPDEVSLAEAFARFGPNGDRRVWCAAQERVRNRQGVSGEWGPDDCRDDPVLSAAAYSVYSAAVAAARTTETALLQLLGALATVDGPKTVVLLSQGLVTGASGGDLGGNRRLATIADAAASARTTFYTILADRTFLEAMDVEERTMPQTLSRDQQLQADGLEAIAGYTGGPFFKAVAVPDFAFQRIATETSAGWLLSFEPEENDRDGKPHDIKVSLGRKGLDVRARPQFVVNAPAVPATAEGRVARALQATVPPAGLPVAMAAYALGQGERGGVRLLVAVEVGLDPAAAPAAAVGFRLLDEAGGQAAVGIETGALEPLARAPGVLYGSHSFMVQPGRYLVRAAVGEAGGRTGGVEQAVEARLHAGGGGVAISDLLLARSGARASGGPALQVDGRVGPETMRAYVELQDDSAEPPSVQFEVLRAASGEMVQVDGAPPRLSPEGRLTAETTIDFISIEPGRYLVRAIASRGGREVARVDRPIEVTATAAAAR